MLTAIHIIEILVVIIALALLINTVVVLYKRALINKIRYYEYVANYPNDDFSIEMYQSGGKISLSSIKEKVSSTKDAAKEKIEATLNKAKDILFDVKDLGLVFIQKHNSEVEQVLGPFPAIVRNVYKIASKILNGDSIPSIAATILAKSATFAPPLILAQLKSFGKKFTNKKEIDVFVTSTSSSIIKLFGSITEEEISTMTEKSKKVLLPVMRMAREHPDQIQQKIQIVMNFVTQDPAKITIDGTIEMLAELFGLKEIYNSLKSVATNLHSYGKFVKGIRTEHLNIVEQLKKGRSETFGKILDISFDMVENDIASVDSLLGLSKMCQMFDDDEALAEIVTDMDEITENFGETIQNVLVSMLETASACPNCSKHLKTQDMQNTISKLISLVKNPNSFINPLKTFSEKIKSAQTMDRVMGFVELIQSINALF